MWAVTDNYRFPTTVTGPLIPEEERFAINACVYVEPDATEAPLVARGLAARVLFDPGAANVELVFEQHGPASVPRSAVRRERRGTWTPPWTYAEVPAIPGDDPLGPPRVVPTA
jgi:hypothetical protein